MANYKVDVASEHCCQLGEGPHWDTRSQTLYYVDLPAGDICRLDPNTKKSKVTHFGNTATVIIPVKSGKNEFIVAEDNKLFKFDWNSNERKLLAEVETNVDGNRFNDGKCDTSGRLWIGTMGPLIDTDVWATDRGALYSYENSKITKRHSPVSLSNGIAWSLDNKIMYFVDSVSRSVYAFDFDVSTGSIANQRVLLDLSKTNKDFAKNVVPDGMTIDREGFLWVALYNGAQVIKVSTKTGQIVDSVSLPTSCITSVCFGGPQLNQLFVTSASEPLDAERRAREPKAGHLFVITSDSPGFAGFETSVEFSK